MRGHIRVGLSALLIAFALGLVPLDVATAGDATFLNPPPAWNWTWPLDLAPTGPTTNAMLGDTNADGRADAVTYQNGTWRVATSTGSMFNESSQLASNLGVTGSQPVETMVADVNNDKAVDAIAVQGGEWTVAVRSGNKFGNGTGPYPNWAHAHGVPGPGLTVKPMMGDMNGDGRSDAIALTNGTWAVRKSTGSAFASPTTWNPGFNLPNAKNLVGDVNGDGKADAVGVDGDLWRVAISNGNGFNPNTTWLTGFAPAAGLPSKMMLAYINGDTKADAVIISDSDWNVALANSTGTGFNAPTRWSKSFSSAGAGPSHLFAANVASSAAASPADAIALVDGMWRVNSSKSVIDQIKTPNSGWSMIFDDEFDGSTLDTSKWNDLRYDYWLTGAPKGMPYSKVYNEAEDEATVDYTPANNSVGQGLLKQKIGAQTVGGSTTYTVGSVNTLPRIDSQGAYVPNSGFRFKSGYVEARVRVPDCTGCWPAFWMLPTPPSNETSWLAPSNYPAYPQEVDIFEFFPQNVPDTRVAYNNVIWGDTTHRWDLDTPAPDPAYPEYPMPPILRNPVKSPLTGEFHRYGFLWGTTFYGASYLQFFIDDIPGPRISNATPTYDMYLISTLQRAGSAITPDGVTMETDYVHVYQ